MQIEKNTRLVSDQSHELIHEGQQQCDFALQLTTSKRSEYCTRVRCRFEWDFFIQVFKSELCWKTEISMKIMFLFLFYYYLWNTGLVHCFASTRESTKIWGSSVS